MTAITVEFIGGPLDGEIRAIPAGTRAWKIALASFPMTWIRDYEPQDELAPVVRTGVYSCRDDLSQFYWLGEC